MFNHSVCKLQLAFIALVLLSCPVSTSAQTTAFTYQGRLTDGPNPANGAFDMEFKLFDLATVGNQQGPTVTRLNVMVTAGTFSVQLDFGVCTVCFPGAKRYLEISVKPAGDPAYTTLSPRQQILSAPYSLKSANATTADSLSGLCINCVTSSQIASVNGSAVTGTIPVAGIPAGSDSYIQNTTTQQAASNFNINGNGVVGGSLGIGTSTPAAALHVRGVSPVRILGDTSTLSGSEFVDFMARSSIFSSDLGGMRIQRQAGSGDIDTLLYAAAAGNSASEKMRVTGSGNVGIGTNSPVALLHVRGASPVRILGDAPLLTGGEYVDFMARSSGLAADVGGMRILRQTGTGNIDTLFFATPFGSPPWEVMRVSGTGNVGIGTISPLTKLHLDGSNSRLRLQSRNPNVWTQTEYVTDSREWHIGVGGSAVTNDINNKYYIGDATLGLVRLVVDTLGRVGIGTTSPGTLLHLRNDVSGALGPTLTLMNGGGGAGAKVSIDLPVYDPLGNFPSARISVVDDGNFSSYIRFFNKIPGAIGNQLAERLTIAPDGNVGMGRNPSVKLDVFGDIRIGTVGSLGCVTSADFTPIAGTCSSDIRLKRDITPFPRLLDKLVLLQPVHFYWRADEFPNKHLGTQQSYGLIAQEVENVLPELVTEDEQSYKAVNYSKLPLLLLQAIKEQQQQINQLRTQLNETRVEIESLKRVICLSHPRAESCRGADIKALRH